MREFSIACLPGDGVGPEIIREGVRVLEAAQSLVGGFILQFTQYDAGAALYARTGVIFPTESYDACRAADAIFLGAMGLPDVVQADGTEVQGKIIVEMRKRFNLFAGVRPIKLYPGVVSPLRDATAIDLVIMRESSEGLFASFQAGAEVYDKVFVDSMVITREGTEKICDFAFRYARRRSGRPADGRRVVTCVDKANNFRAMAFWRSIYNEVAEKYPDIARDYAYVDAINVSLIQRPQDYDVIVVENIFGDIISDMAAALVGGMGMAPSGDIGLERGLFQPAHGSAPTIAGKNIVNPVATILSGGMMLDWLGDNHGLPTMTRAATLIEDAVAATLAAGCKTVDIGGDASTTAFGEAVVKAMEGMAKDSKYAG
ncbi:MAG: isocitrate/isopropylmalate dehydrogenase family protein [Planctomycetes bacterium]|nr:isocitrate/isopropylmalate dehydrogenase family protein [Planctomycetota bacterium]